MAMNATTVQPLTLPNPKPSHSLDALTPFLAAALLSAYGVHKSRKPLRRLKFKLAGAALKQKFLSLFSRDKGTISNRLLIYILIAIIFLALLAIEPLYALIIALIALVLVLAKVI